MKFKVKLRNVGQKLWSRETLVCVFIIAIVVTVFLILARVPSSSSVDEVRVAADASTLQNIYDSPVNAPYKLTAYAVTSISPSIVYLRAISFIIFGVTSLSMFFALRHWHTTRAAVLATLMFATNSIVLGTARLGTTQVTVFIWYIFTSLLLWQIHSKSNRLVPILASLGFVALLYTPGALWFFIIMVAVYFNKVRLLYKDVKRNAVVIGAILAILMLIPLIMNFIRDIGALKEWLLLPQELIWSEVPFSILQVPSAFLYRMPNAPLINVSTLPVFDLASGMLFLIGLNAYRKKLSLDRTRIMLGSALVGVVVGALGQTITAVILLTPFAFSIIAAGIEFLVDEWRTVFPRNPYAKGFGSLLITIVVLFGAYYQLTRFFVVWPQTLETRQVYDQPRVIDR